MVLKFVYDFFSIVCYGVDISNNNKWYCQKCQYLQEVEHKNKTGEIDIITNEKEDVCCCLCLMRGGALKRTTNGNWCHIVCAIAVPEVFFEDKQNRNHINIDKLNIARTKLVLNTFYDFYILISL